MKRTPIKTLITTVAVSLFALSMVAGCSTTSSENVKTSGIWAHFSVDHYPDGEVICWGVLRVGGSTGTMIDLTGGEHLECNGSTMSEYVEPITEYRWNRAVVTEDVDRLYDFLFVRTDDEINTTVEMPMPPYILALDPSDVVYDGESLTITWDADYPGDDVDIRVDGTCIDNLSAVAEADNGEYTFPEVLLSVDAIDTACTLEIRVVRVFEDDVNSAFQGGYTQANRIETDTIPFEAATL